MGEWHHYRLGELGETYTGLTGKTKDDFGSGKPFIPYKNIFYNATINPEWLDYVQVSEGERQYRVQYGDIFFTTSSETPDEVGMSSVLLDDLGECYLNSFCFGFRLHDFSVLLPQYARYLFRGEDFRRQMYALSQGSTRFNLSKRELLKSELVLPPLAEQKKIAEILSTWDEAIALTEQLIDALERRKKGLMQRLLTGAVRFPEYVRSNDVIETKYGDIPADWGYVPIGEVAREVSRKNDGGRDLTVLSCTKYDGLVDSLEYFGRQIFSDDTSTYKLVARGQFAYATNHIEEGSIGYQDLYDCALISPMYTVFETERGLIDDRYLFKLLKTELYRHIFEVSTSGTVNRRGSLRWNDFSRIHIPLPPLHEQQAIAEVLETSDQEIKLVQRQRDALQQQKKGLMQRLLTGQVRVRV